ncbi:YbjN domain-containing protein [Roseospirillum parvum]|uniref:Putative sensory transduction regulator n=1 Tax=Roseospirillum parvum TaxID=83401 RepID=A0A1G7V638_9PROT|nr:YbjN domain-containing protein [Roseospirillum parvum]SDG54420.1 Putative sensory transduction regulator [Roseospirillum parvum]
MRLWLAAFLTATALILVGCPPVRGESVVKPVYEGISGSELVQLMQDWGYRADLDQDGEGDPRIQSSTGGLNFVVHFYECQPDGAEPVCGSLSVGAVFEGAVNHGVDSMNHWNALNRFGKAYRADNGDLWVEMDIALEGGISEANLRDWLAWWEAVLGKFARHIDW